MDVTVVNGERIRTNEHVYCASNWAIRDGTPYSIARVMEFLPAEGLSTSRTKGKGREVFTRVRIAWYYRPGDISDRQVSDSRLLLAAIYTEVIPITHIRGRCWVRHKDKIPDLAAWRKKPDRFYYQRLFDPFIKKEFEVLPTVEIHNLPRHIKDILISRYEYVVAEKEVVPNLMDSLRLCETCGEWCPTPDSVQCAGCKNHFHMACVQPPLMAKPSRGYGWTCAPCSRRREDQVDGAERNTPPSKPPARSNTAASKIRSRQRKERHSNIVNVEDDTDRYFKMWPFRYFGAYVNAEDAMDPDDLIFVRASPHIGQRYQVTVNSTWEPGNPSGSAEATIDLPERGGDATVEALSSICLMPEEQVNEAEERLRAMAPRAEKLSSVDWLTEAVLRLSAAAQAKQALSSVSMKSPLRLCKWAKFETRYTDKEWSDSELVAFEDGLSLHGPELRAVRDEVHSRTMPEVVRYFGLFKSKCLGIENKMRKAEAAKADSIANRSTPQIQQPLVTNDEEDSIAKPDPGKRSTSCAACGVTSSDTWWKAPKGLSTAVLCGFCGIAWRKYGDLTLRSGREEALPSHKARAAIAEKREGTPLVGPNAKKAKLTNGPPVPDRIPVKQLPCQCCKKYGPVGKVLKCSQCTLSAHSVVCGASLQEGESADDWLCSLCQNDKVMEASLDHRCVLCPRPSRGTKESDFLRACKPTEGQGWAHVLCALYFREIKFSDADKLKTVEGINSIASYRWKRPCSLCNEEGGAVARCADCPKEFHVSCAYRAGYRFGFEIMPIKNSRRDWIPTTTFKKETGMMNLYFWCTAHVLTFKKIYDLCEVSPETGETAMQVFNRAYKQVPQESTHALLRKAQRLDEIMNAARREKSTRDGPPQPVVIRCRHCQTEHSPFFHKVVLEMTATAFECHRCRFDAQAAGGEPIVWKMQT